MFPNEDNNIGDFVVFKHGRLDVKCRLGEGNFGQVFHVLDNRRKPFTLRKMRCVNRSMFSIIGTELQNTLLNVKHDNVSRFYDFDFDTDELTIALFVTEHCERGNLNDRLCDEVEDSTKYSWMMQLISGLRYLHDKHILHRDLKPSNVLLNIHDDVKIADYGLAKRLLCLKRGNLNYNTDETSYLSEYIENSTNYFPANECWFPPEIFKLSEEYSEKSDVFSLGLLMYAIKSRQCISVDGKRCFGCFIHFRGEQLGLGKAMYRAKEQIIPAYQGFRENPTSAQLQSLLQNILLVDSRDRMDLRDIEAVFKDVYQGRFANNDQNGVANHRLAQQGAAQQNGAQQATSWWSLCSIQ